eukprot:scaffold60724_cov56-Attheya_sp.AAC.2
MRYMYVYGCLPRPAVDAVALVSTIARRGVPLPRFQNVAGRPLSKKAARGRLWVTSYKFES